MAWNRPTEDVKKVAPKKATGRPLSPAFVIILIAIVAAIGAACYFLFFASTREPAAEEDAAKQPAKEISFDAAKAPADADVETKKPEENKGGPGGGKPSRFVDGHYVSPDPAYAEMKKYREEQAKNDPFVYLSDNMICNIVCAEPGDRLFPIPFDDHFMKEFKESFKSPIIVMHDDPPEIQEKKRLVNEAKTWLKEEMENGNDIKKLLTEARDKVNALSDLTMFYRGEIIDMKDREGVTRQDLVDFVDAANKIIDKYVEDNFDFPHNTEKAHVKLPRGFLK